MKKRIFSILIALCLMVGLLPVVAFAAEEPALPEATVEKLGATAYTGDYYSYDLVGNQSLTKYNGTLGMQVAMKFTAKDSAEQAAAHYYADYTTDFYIEINGLADGEAIGNGCYLAGYYEAYGMWVKIPLDGFKIENGKVYPVITSAGFDFDYEAICSEVESFTCGIYFSKEFLAANPNLEVTLSMGLSETYEQATKAEFITVEEYVYDATDMKALPEAIVEKLGATTYTGDYYSYDLVGNQSLTKYNGDIAMQIAMKFTAKDSAEQAAAHYYADYTTDFYIEINGLADGEAIGKGCYLAGYYEAYGMWVKIPLDGFKIENGKVYPVITSAGFDFDYEAICSEVESFTCGIYFSDEFLAANPNLEVTLSMGLSETYEQATKAEFITVEAYTYSGADFGIETDTKPTLIVNEKNTLVMTDTEENHIHHRVTVYYLGEQTVENIYDEAALKAIDSAAKTYWGAAEINKVQLGKAGNYVLVLNYNNGVGTKKETVCFAASVELLLPTVEVENNKVVATAGDANIKNYRAVVYYLGNRTVADIYDEAALKAIDPSAQTTWGINAINKIQLLKGGNYVIQLQFNVGTNKQIVATTATVAFDGLTLEVVNGNVVAADPDKAYIYHRAVVYYLGDKTVEDIYDEAALKAIDPTAKTYWELSEINKAKLTKTGNYVVMLHYNLPKSPKMTMAVRVGF